MMIKVLILGANGQLGKEVTRQAPSSCRVISLSAKELDITDAEAVDKALANYQPDWIINAAAYTAVDKAEKDMDLAFEINARAIAHLANKVAPQTWILHISTDFVFDGKKSSPYVPKDTPNPLSVYGSSKLEGELALMKYHPDRSLIIRTAWLYSATGHNFLLTMLRLMGSRKELSVVDDQVGVPTSVRSLAKVIWANIERPANGIFHWADDGRTSWHGFACEIQQQALSLGLLEHAIAIKPIHTEDYPTPARRPAFSVLDNSETCAHLGIDARTWQEELDTVLNEIKADRGKASP